MEAITIVSEGRRHYIRGNTYPIKDKLRDAGCKWDGAAKAWWTGKREVAEQIVASAPATVPVAPGSDPGASREAPGEDAVVAGKATYKGKTYFVAGRIDRGRTHYDDRVSQVRTRDGGKVLLFSRDGKLQFWAASGEATIAKSYDRPQTIGRLARFAEEAKQARSDGNDDGIPNGRRYACEECGEFVVRGDGSSCWETGAAH